MPNGGPCVGRHSKLGLRACMNRRGGGCGKRLVQRAVLVLWYFVLASCWPGVTHGAFEYPLRGAKVMRDAVAAGRLYSDVTKLVEDKYADIEARWQRALPIAGGDAVSPPISEWPTAGRGQYMERRDYTLNVCLCVFVSVCM